MLCIYDLEIKIQHRSDIIFPLVVNTLKQTARRSDSGFLIGGGFGLGFGCFSLFQQVPLTN